MVVPKRVLLLYLIFYCLKQVHSAKSEQFNFKDTFKTPRQIYEDNVAKLDQLEILERSSFPSDKSKTEPIATASAKEDNPKAVANAQVNLRLPDLENRQGFTQPYLGYHPHAHCYFNSFPMPFYHPYFVDPYHSFHKKNVEHSKPCTINIINVFATPKAACPKESGKVPHVYLDGNLNEVLNQNVTKLTSKDFAAIDNIIDSGIFNTTPCPKEETWCGREPCVREQDNGSSPSEEYEKPNTPDRAPSSDRSHRQRTEGILPEPPAPRDKERFNHARCACTPEYIRFDDCVREAPVYVVQEGDEDPRRRPYPTRGQSMLVPWYSWRSAKPEQHYIKQIDNRREKYRPRTVVYEVPKSCRDY